MIGNFLRIYILIIFISNLSLFAFDNSVGTTVVPNDKSYYKYKIKNKNIEVIYTKDNILFAKDTIRKEKALNDDYENFFNWKLDDTLYVGLISDHNEIANAISSQWPINRQINYIGGSGSVDFFANTSWLDTLLYHETAHNYQTNVKASIVSRTFHYIFGNGIFILPTYFTVPGSATNSFMLEGNAVLNESWHGSGGRLYNGRLKAMSILQAKAKNIKSKYMYNKMLKFPYKGEIYYQIGSFYNLFMAKKYGVKKLNSYFLQKTQDWWWPFYTNNSMKRAVGVSFEESLENFAYKYKKMADKFIQVKGEIVASSQFYTQLSSNEDEIFFITNETGYREPELIVINKKSEKLTKKRDSWIPSKVIKKDGKYYTQASKNISATKILQGLYDNNAFIKDGTESKMLQGYLSDSRDVYFDVASSYDYPKLYIGDRYYGYTNSSLFIDKNDNLYYFKNKNKIRTLYKNKKALYSYEGFYGIVADVDSKGVVYFIANSKLGTSLYRYKNNQVTRASSADNIVEAKLINDNKVLFSALSDRDYYYVKSGLESIDQEPYNTKLFFESKPYYKKYKTEKNIQTTDVDTLNPYVALFDMHYSSSNFSSRVDSAGTIMGMLDTKFEDILSQNRANVFIRREDSNTTVLGLGYTNKQYVLEYKVKAYTTINQYKNINTRSNGLMALLKYSFYKAGYYNASSKLTYFQDYNTLKREPLTISISVSRDEQYGISMYKNYKNFINIYDVKERGDNIYGASYRFEHDLGAEFYIKIGAKYSKTDSDISPFSAYSQTRGVKISPISYQLDMDSSTIVMPSINNYFYIKGVKYVDFALYKVINLPAYFFTFPISLQRESIYSKYRYYDVETFNTSVKHEKVKELMIGVRFDTIFFNVLGPLALSFNYYYNDNQDFARDTSKLTFSIDGKF